MIEEILQVPGAARRCYELNRQIRLPQYVPYIGIGSSWFAPLVMKYCGLSIQPEVASEYFHFLAPGGTGKQAVLISQSGRSSEVLWCANKFDTLVVLTNDTGSPLAKHPHTSQVVDMAAGEEKLSSTKTYINTLVALYLGLGIDPLPAITILDQVMTEYEQLGRHWAQLTYELYRSGGWKGAFILGNGPNLGSAMQAALVLTESSGIPFQAMSLAEFDHGPKESAPGSLIFIISTGNAYEQRQSGLVKMLEEAGAKVLILHAGSCPEMLSPIHSVIPFFYTCHYLAEKLGRRQPFVLGGKITETNPLHP